MVSQCSLPSDELLAQVDDSELSKLIYCVISFSIMSSSLCCVHFNLCVFNSYECCAQVRLRVPIQLLVEKRQRVCASSTEYTSRIKIMLSISWKSVP